MRLVFDLRLALISNIKVLTRILKHGVCVRTHACVCVFVEEAWFE